MAVAGTWQNHNHFHFNCWSFGSGIYGLFGRSHQGYDTNLIDQGSVYSVAEAMNMIVHPEMAVITALDPDHLDIYKTPEAMEDSFRQFASQVKSRLIVREGAI